MQNEQSTATVYLNGEQAKSELAALDIRAKELRKSIKQASEIGDLAGIKRYTKELKDVSGQMKVVKSESFNAKKVLDDLSGATLRDLYGAQKKIDSLLRNGSVKRNSDEWKELAKSQRAVKTEISKVNSEMYAGESRWSKMTSKVGMFLGISTGIAVVGGLISNAGRQILEFSKAVSELSALTGATGADLDYLKDKAKELGAQYGKSATEIITAMKLVGSAKPELLSNVEALAEVTDSVLLLSQATGMDLTESTKNVTTIMNQFGLAAIESDRTVNVLAAGSKFGAVEVDYLGEAISKVGTVSKSANISLEKTTAAMELFGEKGIKAEVAGTGFKSVLVKLQSDTKNYTNGLFDLNKAIDNNQKISGNNIALQEKFGKEFFNVAQILFQNKARFEELTKQVTGTTTALEMAKVASDNLSGDISKMTSSWNTFILSLEDGKGPIANAFRTLTQWVRGTLDELSKLTKDSDQKAAASAKRAAESRIESLKDVLREQSKAHQQEMEMETDPKKKQQLELDYQKKRAEYVNGEIKSNRGLAQQYAEKANALAAENKQTADWIVATEKYLKGSRDINFERTKNLSIAKNDFEAKNKEIKSLRESANAYYIYVNSVGALGKALKQIAPLATSGVKPTGNSDDKVATQKKELDLIAQVIDNAHTDRLTKLKAAKVKEKQTEVEYNNEVMTEDVAYYNLKLAALEKFKKGVKDKNFLADINKQINELKDKKAELDVKFQERINKILLDADPVKKENLEYDDRLRELGLFNKKRENMTSDELSVFEMLESQHQDNLFKIREKADSLNLKQAEDKFDKEYSLTKEAYDEVLEFLSKNAELSKKTGTSFSEFKEIDTDPEILLARKRIEAIKSEISAKRKAGLETTKLNDDLLRSENQLTDEYVQKYQQRAQLFGKFGEELGSTIGNLAIGNQDALKSSLVSMIDMGLDYLKAQAEMAIAGATVQSLAMPDSILTFGASGVARAAILVGLIEAAFAASKTIIGNAIGYSDGGFTEPGDKYKPAGIVHAGEFVANQDAVRSAPMRKVFNLIDHAQKTNTVARITPEDISRAVGMKSGYSADNYSSPGAAAGGNSVPGISAEDLNAMRNTMAQTNAVNAELLKQIKQGIVAKSVISGNDGTAKKLEEYNKLISNAKG